MKKLQRLEKCRIENHLTQSDVAKLLNTTQKQYSRWETGQYQIPLENLIYLAKIYNVSLDYLCELTDNKQVY